jgi:hypothetical protein
LPTGGRRRRLRDPRDAPLRRLRRTAALSATFLLGLALISLGISLAQNSGTPASIQTVEWLRDNGLRGLVNQVEAFYYTIEAPSKGGPTIKHLPPQVGRTVAGLAPTVGNPRLPGGVTSGQTGGVRHHLVPHYAPPAIQPVIHPALAGEGTWRAPFTGITAGPPVLITSFRSDPAYPRTVAGVAWIDHTQTSVMLYPGVQEPAVSLPDRGPEEIPITLRGKLLAAFNSAFKLADSGGGFGLGGVTYAPMRDGQATIVRYRDGRVDIVDWRSGPRVGPDVVYARQNLPLIVSGGKPNPTLSGGPEWGATLGNAVLVWRSALGIDSRGNLIYAAAPDQTATSLAAIMIHAGAVRAMELDINAYWPSFITYTGANAAGAANLLPGMNRSPQRYLTPDDRDFFAVYLR